MNCSKGIFHPNEPTPGSSGTPLLRIVVPDSPRYVASRAAQSFTYLDIWHSADFCCRMLAEFMSDLRKPLESRISQEPEDFGHPRGTLAIVGAFGLLFLLGWLIFYVYLFMQRGAPTLR